MRPTVPLPLVSHGLILVLSWWFLVKPCENLTNLPLSTPNGHSSSQSDHHFSEQFVLQHWAPKSHFVLKKMANVHNQI